MSDTTWNTGAAIVCCPAPGCGMPFNPLLDYRQHPPARLAKAKKFCRPGCARRATNAKRRHERRQARIRAEARVWEAIGQLRLPLA